MKNEDFVVFLDWDGVFRCTFITTITRDIVNRNAVAYLNDVILHCNCHVVVSSMHRGGRSKAELEEELAGFGFVGLSLHEDFKTRQPLTPNEPRGKQVRDWLKNHKEVKDYLIIDDDSDWVKGQWPHWVMVDGQEGFQATNYKVAIQLFNQRIK